MTEKNTDTYIIREIRADELNILKDMLYEAIFIPQGVDPPSRDVITKPEIARYIDGFGKKDDYCLVAEVDGRVIGAVWVRILAGENKGYGNIDEHTPEFSISLFKEYRGRGIGTELMKRMIGYLKERGYAKTSLSVNKDNYAVQMYQNVGFKIISENREDYIMVLELDKVLIEQVTLEILEEWKAVWHEYKHRLRPNRKSGTEIVEYLSEKYPLRELDDKRATQVVIDNVLLNKPFAEKLPEGKQPSPVTFIVENTGEGRKMYKEQDKIHEGIEIFVGIDLESGWYCVEGSSLLGDELCAFQGLDEKDIENFFCVARYISAIKKFGLLESTLNKF